MAHRWPSKQERIAELEAVIERSVSLAEQAPVKWAASSDWFLWRVIFEVNNGLIMDIYFLKKIMDLLMDLITVDNGPHNFLSCQSHELVGYGSIPINTIF